MHLYQLDQFHGTGRCVCGEPERHEHHPHAPAPGTVGRCKCTRPLDWVGHRPTRPTR